MRFVAELNAKKQRDPVWKEKQSKLVKPSGRQIFEKTKTLTEFYEDEKGDDDDEDIDIKKMRDAKGDELDENVDIDEDVFGEEDDLEDIDESDLEEETEEDKVAKLFL